jgi:hypothetical protein
MASSRQQLCSAIPMKGPGDLTGGFPTRNKLIGHLTLWVPDHAPQVDCGPCAPPASPSPPRGSGTAAAMVPHFVHTMRGPNDGTQGTSSELTSGNRYFGGGGPRCRLCAELDSNRCR